ncbi:MAG: polysaccharide deacetylase family protein [Gemmatimonadaceae bacterium]|nr:polysaccharide deacetylase family protein [Gemmatimonadaceae bacterium]
MRAILTYHSIDPSGSPISVSPAAFRAHVRWLASGAVRVLPLEQLVATDDSDDAVAISFDDGFENFATEGAALLAEHGLPSTVFVVSEHAGGTNAWGGSDAPGIPTLPLMSWSTLARVARNGVTLGAHTRRHRDLTRARGAALEDEVAGCVERIAAETGKRPTTFAYPYGAVDDTSASVVRDVFALACTTELRALHPHDDRALLPRLDMYYFRDPGQLEAWGTAAFRGRLWLRAQARRVRRLVQGAGRAA